MHQEASQSWREDRGLSQLGPALLLLLHVKGYKALIWASCYTCNAFFALHAAVCQDPRSVFQGGLLEFRPHLHLIL